MIACDVAEHRELVGWMARTLAACRKSEKTGRFDMWSVMHDCGSPQCVAGHGAAELGYGLRECNPMTVSRAMLGFPIDWDVWDMDKKYTRGKRCMLEEEGDWWFCGGMENDEALRRWTLTLNYRRRQLAQLEVEAGEWGRSKPARDMPVGQERERRVAELVGGWATLCKRWMR